MNLDTQQDLTCPSVCYRMDRRDLIMVVIFTTLFLIMDVGSVYYTFWNIDGSIPNPVLAALFFGSFFSFWVALGFWSIISYFRERLFVSKYEIAQHGMIFKKTMRAENVIQVIWQRSPANRYIVIRDHDSKIKINLDKYTKEKRKELIQSIHNAFDQDIQKDWGKFAKTLLPPKPQTTLEAILTSLACAVLLFATSGVLIYHWFTNLGTVWGILGGLCIFGGIWYLWRSYRKYRSPENSDSCSDRILHEVLATDETETSVSAVHDGD